MNKGGKWSKRGIPGANPDAPKEKPPPSVPRNILMRPLEMPAMVPIHSEAKRVRAELDGYAP